MKVFYVILTICILTLTSSCSNGLDTAASKGINEELVKELIHLERESVILLADSFLTAPISTVTASSCPRSAGGLHDYYSEATYWWPNPENPEGPYIRKDGMNNPDNFDDHLKAIGHFSWIVGTETSAYLLTGHKVYAEAAVKQIKAWFVDTATQMNPHLLYAQAITGVNTGRGIGIIDAISLIEVTKSISILSKTPYLSQDDFQTTQTWFRNFMTWLNTHPYGIAEMNAKNNHGTWWHAQVVAYANFVGDTTVLGKCKLHFTNTILPNQMAENGSFPLELKRTKPYSYSLFNLDGMAALAVQLSNETFDAWNFTLPDGRGMQKGVDYMKPYVMDKSTWIYPPDVLYWDEQPGRRPFMIFSALMQNQPEWISIWKKCSPDFPSAESKRNMPLKNPLLWLGISQAPTVK